MKQNLFKTLLLSIAFALVGVLIWGAVSYYFDLRIGIVGIAIGFAVGKTLNKSNPFGSMSIGIISVIITLIAIILGELFSLVLLVKAEYGLTFMESITGIDYSAAFGIIIESSGIRSIAIYVISLIEAFKFATAGFEQTDAIDNDLNEDIV